MPTPLPVVVTSSPDSPAEWFTAAVALVAVVLSYLAFRTARAAERRQAFMPLHDRLTSLESQEGRRIMHSEMTSAGAIDRMFRRRPRRFDLVNRTLGLYNTLGIYAHRGFIPEDVALDQWAGRVRRGWPAIERFLRYRRAQSGDPHMWSYLVWFAEESGADVPEDLRVKQGWTTRLPVRGAAAPRRPVPRS